MSTLAESLLNDFDEEEEEEEEKEKVQDQVNGEKTVIKKEAISSGLEANALAAKTPSTELESELSQLLSKVPSSSSSSFPFPSSSSDAQQRETVQLESGLSDDAMYKRVTEANSLCVEVDAAVFKVHREVVDRFSQRFPELESHVPDPIEYLRAVQLIQNESNMGRVELSDVLNPAQILAVSMTGAKLKTPKLETRDLEYILRLCDISLELARRKTQILIPMVSRHMSKIAPNMTELLGPDITAQLLSLVGGLENLIRIPGGNIFMIGKGEKAMHGFAKVPGMIHFGVIHGCSLVQECLAEHQVKAMRVVAGRVSLAARLDHAKSDREATAAKGWVEEIRNKLKKWHTPPPGKTKRALPVPVTDKKKTRGGRRARRMKEIYGMTEVRKQTNRLQFGVGTDEYGDSAMGNTLGALGQEGSGRVRISQKEQKKMKVNFAKDHKGGVLSQATIDRKNLMNSLSGTASVIPGASTTTPHGATSGLASSVAFGGEGVQLSNPAAAQKRVEEANRKFFGDLSFKKRKTLE